jgi:hypothetical protein
MQRDAFGMPDLFPIDIRSALPIGGSHGPYRNVSADLARVMRGQANMIAIDVMPFSLYINTKYATTRKATR